MARHILAAFQRSIHFSNACIDYVQLNIISLDSSASKASNIKVFFASNRTTLSSGFKFQLKFTLSTLKALRKLL
tara:strand:- start:39 stop:260 length:222 start_codon:yes stop_codon:yes gene_type:complete